MPRISLIPINKPSPNIGHWPVEDIIERGFATAAFWAGGVDLDDLNDDFQNGIHPLLDEGRRDGSSWGAIATWAWGRPECSIA